MLEIKNDIGDIRFSKNVIKRIVDDAVTSCGGKVTLQHFKGKYKRVIPGGEEVIINELPDGMHVDIFVVIRFGASIRENTKGIIQNVEENLLAVMCEKPARVRVIVTGVQSVAIARRNIIISNRINPENCVSESDFADKED